MNFLLGIIAIVLILIYFQGSRSFRLLVATWDMFWARKDYAISAMLFGVLIWLIRSI